MTPRDWEFLSEWLDGTLGAEERVAFERRLATEPELAAAARQLRALSSAASKLGPSTEDTVAAARLSSASRAWVITGLVVLLGVLVGGPILLNSSEPAVPDAVTLAHEPHSMEPSQPRPHVTGSLDAGDAMTRSLDAAVLAPLAAIVVATAAGPSAAEAPRPVASSPGDAGRGTKPTRLAVGGKLRLGAPITSVRALPAGVVVLLDRGGWTLVEGRTPGHVVIETSASDGGTGDRLEVDVESFMTPERPLVVQPGQSRPLLTPGRVRWSIGDPTVASVTEESGGLEVRGERLGNTTVEAWFEDGSSRKWPVQVEPRFGAGEVRLSIGSQKVLTLPSIGEQSVAPAGVATVKSIGNRQLLIVGTAEGVATLEVAQPGKPALRYRLSVSAEPRPPVIDGAQQRSFPPGSAGPLRLRVGRPLLLVTGDIAQGMASDGLRIDLAAPGVVALTAERPLTGTIDLTRVGGVVEHVEVIVEP